MTEADKIWNRAVLESGGPNPAEGDRLLAALLLAHGMVMNGGVMHAIEVLSSRELSAAAAGYRYFSFEGAAALLEEASKKYEATMDDEEENSLIRAYGREIASDSVIAKRFEDKLASEPKAFAPL